MADHGPGSAKKPRMNSRGGGGGGLGSHHPLRQHSDISSAPQEHAVAGRPLAPPKAYRAQAPHSPYQMQENTDLQEHGAHEGHLPSQSVTALPQRDLRSAPPLQTTFLKLNHHATTRSPESAPISRPLNTAFEGGSGQYGPHSASEAVESSPMYPPPEGPPGSYTPVMVAPSPYDPHHGTPVPGHYGEGEVPPHPPLPPAHPYTQMYGVAQAWPRPQPPRRHVRAAQACDTCRTRKVKCDEGKPQCSYCRENDQHCVYKEIQPAKQDRAQKELMQAVSKQQEDISYLHGQVGDMNVKIDHIVRILSSQATAATPATPAGDLGASSESKEPLLSDSAMEVQTSQPDASSSTERAQSQIMAPPTAVNKKRESLNDGSGSAGQIVDHSVGVHRLFRWPTMQILTSEPSVLNALHITKISDLSQDFILQMEQEKGMLRIYGVGQGHDNFDGAATISTAPDASTPPSMGDSNRDPVVRKSPAASPPHVWGTGLSAPNLVDDRYANGSANDHPGGLNRDGSLKMDGDTMWSLFLSYMRNVHQMHPFLQELRLRRMLDRVWRHMNPWEKPKSQFVPSATVEPLSMPRKRRRSTDTEHPFAERPEPEHRISTVIVLLVMALGKMCQETRPLCGPVPENLSVAMSRHNSHPSASPAVQGSPAQFSSPSMQSPMSAPSASVPEHRVRLHGGESEYQVKITSQFREHDKNVDVVPGLAYFAYATKILGALQGGNDLSFVQANLLACLYCGQHASSIQSWWYLNQACRICLGLMKGHPFQLETQLDSVRVAQTYMAYWTCYQLESDILAELDLEPSGIDYPAQHENPPLHVPKLDFDKVGPKALKTEEMANSEAYYHYQLFLRNTLNKIQPLMYPPNAYLRARRLDFMLEARHNCRLSMQEWRDMLLGTMKWEDEDPPSRDILEARLRAKYYGAMYIVNRPLLEYALHNMGKETTPPDVIQNVKEYQHSHRVTCVDDIELIRDEMQVYYACVDCIQAAKRSTVAFDGIVFEENVPRNRLIVTNIFGTAHAQFGNMLVLSVTFKSRLSFLIERAELMRLFDRTIAFLDILSPVSKTLAQDRNILIAIRQNINSPLPDFESTTSSFSSSA